MTLWLWLHARAVLLALRLRRLLRKGELVLPDPGRTTKGPLPPARTVSLAFLASRRAAHRLTPLNTCLTRSLLLHQLLSRWGGVEIRYGMRKQADRLDGHAWVVVDGRPVGEEGVDLDSYSELREPARSPEVFG